MDLILACDINNGIGKNNTLKENNHINIERKLSNIRLEIREILDRFI